MEVEDVTHLFSKRYFDELIEFNKKIDWVGKSAIIDTNYLIQIQEQDLVSMFFEKSYDESIANPLKKQMSRLLRSFTRKDTTLFFSNSIFREFIYVSPDKANLIRQYSRYLYRIGSKRQFESFFLDLSSLLNLRAKQRGHKVDLLDTYSYVISNLVGIDYFITEDGDLKGIFEYVNEIRNGTHLDKLKEIKELIKLNESFFDIRNSDFPLKEIIEHLFLDEGRLTAPISIKGITDSLQKVSEKAESVVILCEMVNEIQENKKMLKSEELNLLEEALDFVKGICKTIQLEIPESQERINIASVYVNLIEKDRLWQKPPELDKIHYDLFEVLQNIQSRIYADEEEEKYEDLEEYFNSSLSEFELKVRCKCGQQFEVPVYYKGIVSCEQREMGPEALHVWDNYEDCPKCSESLEIEMQLWEYPEGLINYVGFDSNCEILNEDEIYHKIGFTPDK